MAVTIPGIRELMARYDAAMTVVEQARVGALEAARARGATEAIAHAEALAAEQAAGEAAGLAWDAEDRMWDLSGVSGARLRYLSAVAAEMEAGVALAEAQAAQDPTAISRAAEALRRAEAAVDGAWRESRR